MFKRADTLKKICDKRYQKINNPYFINYIDYSIASINASVSRGENYLINGYIANKPIQYNHYEYMQFFNACFKGYLSFRLLPDPYLFPRSRIPTFLSG